MRERRSRVRGPLFGFKGTSGGGLDIPILSAPDDGTPTGDGATGAGVTTTVGSGRLYWAVVTNAGSCTDTQLIAGAGGDIVAGKAANQAVNASGAQTIANITGLAAATTYQIKYLHVGGNNAVSAQASVSLTTL